MLPITINGQRYLCDPRLAREARNGHQLITVREDKPGGRTVTARAGDVEAAITRWLQAESAKILYRCGR